MYAFIHPGKKGPRNISVTLVAYYMGLYLQELYTIDIKYKHKTYETYLYRSSMFCGG